MLCTKEDDSENKMHMKKYIPMKTTLIAILALITLNGFSQVDLGDKVPAFKTTDHNGNEFKVFSLKF